MTKYATPLRIDRRVVDAGTIFRVYKLENLKDGLAEITSGDTQGCVPSTEIVLLVHAVDFYTREISNDHNASEAYFRRGRVRELNSDFELALADYDKAVVLSQHRQRRY